MKKLIFTLFLLGIFMSSAQAQLNEYKYIIVPKKFDAFKRENQYLTSTLVKHLFVERGFTAVYEDALPEELNGNRCLGLTAQVKDESSMFVTKASLVLKDCQAKEVFATEQGSSKQKEFKLSYGEALRQAFKSFDGMDYSYTPGSSPTSSEPVTVSFKNDVKKVDASVTAKVEEKEEVKEDMVAVSTVEKATVIEQEATPEQQSYSNLEPRQSDVKKAPPSITVQEVTEDTSGIEDMDVLYAQAIPNGFQLVDSSPKVVLKLLRTSRSNIYLAKNDLGNGLVYQQNGEWIFEYYEGANLRVEKLNIKF